MLAQADGRYCPRCSAFVKMAFVSTVLSTLFVKDTRVLIILLLCLGLAGFSRVRVRVRISFTVSMMVRFSISDRVDVGLPRTEGVELDVGNMTCSHSQAIIYC